MQSVKRHIVSIEYHMNKSGFLSGNSLSAGVALDLYINQKNPGI